MMDFLKKFKLFFWVILLFAVYAAVCVHNRSIVIFIMSCIIFSGSLLCFDRKQHWIVYGLWGMVVVKYYVIIPILFSFICYIIFSSQLKVWLRTILITLIILLSAFFYVLKVRQRIILSEDLKGEENIKISVNKPEAATHFSVIVEGVIAENNNVYLTIHPVSRENFIVIRPGEQRKNGSICFNNLNQYFDESDEYILQIITDGMLYNDMRVILSVEVPYGKAVVDGYDLKNIPIVTSEF